MVYGIYLSAAGLQTSQYQQEVLTNNLANASTVGFKHDLAIVRERLVESQEDLVDPSWTDPILDRMTGGSLVAPTYTSFDQGPLEKTGGPMDVAIVGDGFFVVEDADGPRYTRDGRFTRNADGEVVTVAGHRPVLDGAGQRIVIPQDVPGPARIDASGHVQASGQVFGRLATVTVDDVEKLVKVGANMFQDLGAQPRPRETHLEVGALEGSTVDPMQSMVSMMQAARLYEMNATLIGIADTTLNRAVNDIARLR